MNNRFRFNKKFTQTISIIRFHWHFQWQTSIVSSFWFFITIMTNQKRRNDWKSLRNLSKHLCEMNFSYFIFKSSNNHSRTMISIFTFRCRYQESEYQKHFQELIERRFKNKTKYSCQEIIWRFQYDVFSTIENLHRSQNRLNTMSFKIKTTIENLRSIKLTENQSKYIVSSTFRSRELSMQQTKSYSNFMKIILFQ